MAVVLIPVMPGGDRLEQHAGLVRNSSQQNMDVTHFPVYAFVHDADLTRSVLYYDLIDAEPWY